MNIPHDKIKTFYEDDLLSVFNKCINEFKMREKNGSMCITIGNKYLWNDEHGEICGGYRQKEYIKTATELKHFEKWKEDAEKEIGKECIKITYNKTLSDPYMDLMCYTKPYKDENDKIDVVEFSLDCWQPTPIKPINTGLSYIFEKRLNYTIEQNRENQSWKMIKEPNTHLLITRPK